MKTTAVMAVCSALWAGAGVQCAHGDDAQEASIHYKQGLSALKDGEAQLARQSFLEALRKQPRHINARIQLDRLRDRAPELAAVKRKQQLAKVLIPNVDYDQVTLPEALEALDLVMKRETNGKLAANFIIQDPGGHFKDRPITLKLSKVPANVVLKHLLSLADGKERYDEYAIVIRPLNTGGRVAAPPAVDPFGQ